MFQNPNFYEKLLKEPPNLILPLPYLPNRVSSVIKLKKIFFFKRARQKLTAKNISRLKHINNTRKKTYLNIYINTALDTYLHNSRICGDLDWMSRMRGIFAYLSKYSVFLNLIFDCCRSHFQIFECCIFAGLC